ncbi:lipoprotein [Streptomyces anthocyanicus]|uniref:Lipoprotein n=1 Tax=Streptomyces coelicolor (strain ATCC BAA-471 / A3(2) / M145) TaxID=100226 RepID=Q9KZC6_STRCO|nr:MULTISPECIES: lipoprotein [Streptomyces]MDX2927837.1 lipoprotein [Streptomyces sp. NRRL_B-16638]MYU46471.1 lipoprotein [Streptomyces sp. SID7813]NSL84373.1 lipoprotein [Streptomyces coelicolor]QFI46737.1 lipoprotein [Streptomyces coelicolor A3(2)]QKN70231.1 lipoprotein [Streptomyces coelicolor]
MSRRPSHPVRLLASALAAGALLTTAACSDGGGSQSASDTAAEEAGVARPDAAKRTPTGSPSASPATLTEAGAKAALLTEADLEGGWNQVQDAGKWRDRLLVGEVDVADFLTAKSSATDCQALLDALYGDGLLGDPSGPSALTGFEQGDSRLLEQVAGYDRGGLDARMKWLRTLPDTCDEFTATGAGGAKRTVQVTEASVPEVGDARAGLRVSVQGDADGGPATLTLDVAAVRVDTSAVTVMGGGLDGGQTDSVEQAVRQGTERLKTVLDGGTPSPQPTTMD